MFKTVQTNRQTNKTTNNNNKQTKTDKNKTKETNKTPIIKYWSWSKKVVAFLRHDVHVAVLTIRDYDNDRIL